MIDYGPWLTGLVIAPFSKSTDRTGRDEHNHPRSARVPLRLANGGSAAARFGKGIEGPCEALGGTPFFVLLGELRAKHGKKGHWVIEHLQRLFFVRVKNKIDPPLWLPK